MNEGSPADPAAPNVTGPRIAAAVIDLVILMIVFAFFVAAFGETEREGGNASFNLTGWPFAAYAVVSLLYYALFEWAAGATPGKLALGLRVISDRPGSLSAGQIALRTILRAVDGLPVFYLAGLVSVAASRKHQRIGDMAAGTLVVKASTATSQS